MFGVSRSMRARGAALFCVSALLPAWAGALSLFRDKIESRWAEKPPAQAGAWASAPETEEKGLVFRALNDGATLYLQISSVNKNGRAILTGVFRQDFTVWFLKPDGKTRDWGILIPYNSLPAPAAATWKDVRRPDEAQIHAPPPEKATLYGSYVSTEPLPGEIVVRGDMTGREPVYELMIPFAKSAKEMQLDCSVSRAPPEIEAQFVRRPARGRHDSASSNMPGHYAIGTEDDQTDRRREAGATDAGPAPEPADYALSIRLARP